MEISKGPMILSTHRPWAARLLDGVIDQWNAWRDRSKRIAGSSPIRLEDLDARTLSDLGLDHSEVSSVLAEARAEAELTRLRIGIFGGYGA